MALIKCSECGKDISDQAEACPHCGNPLRPIVVQATSKRWKLAKLIAWISILVGIYLFLRGYGLDEWSSPMTGFGFTLAFVGFVALMVAKFGSWWNHK
ncbi:MAG: zinc-ribbon domain-containing protein [Candidatus Kerfeldbacteria bacterium]|nr:zinc-ribbon domain-containing protein [Candidatus Kerfeldbacteria bacterium]